LRPVLQHEICHLRRQDNLTALIHMIVEAAFWFHPLVWLIGGRLIAERERACDEFVVSAGTEPEAYAESIIEVCRFHVDAALPCAAGIGSSKLKARIEAIVENRRLRQLSHNGFALLAAAAAAAMAPPVLLGAFGMLPVAAQPAPQTQTQPQIQDQGADAQPDPSSETTQPSPAPDSAVRPISTVPPYYPPQALRQRIEGSVTVEFTITTTGSVRDPVVVSSNPPGVFDEAALQSISQWMYNPLLENGVAVERQGMRTRIDWVLSPTETDVP
jgi:TonB family protein